MTNMTLYFLFYFEVNIFLGFESEEFAYAIVRVLKFRTLFVIFLFPKNSFSGLEFIKASKNSKEGRP